MMVLFVNAEVIPETFIRQRDGIGNVIAGDAIRHQRRRWRRLLLRKCKLGCKSKKRRGANCCKTKSPFVHMLPPELGRIFDAHTLHVVSTAPKPWRYQR